MVLSKPNQVNVSHLFFVDDTLVFCKANASQIRHIGALLVCFEAVVGLKVNLSKSALVLVGSGGDGSISWFIGLRYKGFSVEVFGFTARGFFQAQSYVGGFGGFDVAAVGSFEPVVSLLGR